MKLCEHCGEEAPRRTRCFECTGLLYSFCYQTHQLARAAGDGCLMAFMSATIVSHGADGRKVRH
jgi:hypothetical protein